MILLSILLKLHMLNNLRILDFGWVVHMAVGHMVAVAVAVELMNTGNNLGEILSHHPFLQ